MRSPLAVLILFAVLAVAVAQQQPVDTLTSDIVDAANPDTVIGTATIATHEAGGVIVSLDIQPNEVITEGDHAIHIHENGDCSPGDADGDGTEEPAGAAGGHFNPTDVGHGSDNGPHVGDSEEYNYAFGADGSFQGDVLFPLATFHGDTGVVGMGGTAIVIHEGTDDMSTDPDGDAGERVACAVIVAVLD